MSGTFAAVCGEAVPSTGSADPPRFLDVDVDQLARTTSLIALRGFQAEPAELTEPDPGQDP